MKNFSSICMTPDTVKFTCASQFNELPPTWGASSCKKPGQPDGAPVWLILTHPTKAIRVMGTAIPGEPFISRYVEVELPRMLHPHTGFLLDSQSKIDEAITVVDRELAMVSTKTPLSGDRRFVRVDLAWHFPKDFAELLTTYRYGGIPGFRKQPQVFEKTGMSWIGSHQAFRIYDKAAKLRKDKVEVEADLQVWRLEWKLTGAVLKREFRLDHYPLELNFEQLKAVFIGYLSRHLLHIASSKDTGLAAFFAKKEVTNRGITEEYIAHSRLCGKQATKLRREVSSHAGNRLVQASKKLFPFGEKLKSIHIEGEKRTQPRRG